MPLIDEQPPQHPPARVKQLPPAQTGFGRGFVAPIGAGIADTVKIADGDMDPVVIVAPAGLDQQNLVTGIRREAIGQHAARAAGTDDDEIIFHDLPRPLCPKL